MAELLLDLRAGRAEPRELEVGGVVSGRVWTQQRRRWSQRRGQHGMAVIFQGLNPAGSMGLPTEAHHCRHGVNFTPVLIGPYEESRGSRGILIPYFAHFISYPLVKNCHLYWRVPGGFLGTGYSSELYCTLCTAQ